MSMQKRIPPLDGVRGIAILLVMLHHFSDNFVFPHSLVWELFQRTLAAGWFGVDIFFVLSGYLITGILLNEGRNPNRFYRNRAFRILPAFFVVFSIVLALSPRHRLWVIACYCLFAGNFTILGFNEIPMLNHFWSLGVEEQFYLIWPQIAWRLSRKTVLKIALGVTGLSILFRTIGIALGVNAYVLYKITPTRLDGIALGSAVAAAVGVPAAHRWLSKWWKSVAWMSLLTLAGGFFALKLSLFAWDVRAQMIAIPAVTCLTAMIVFAASQQALPAGISAFLGNRFLVYFGTRSYGLYLIHVPVQLALAHLRERWIPHPSTSLGLIWSFGMLAAAIGLSIALAEVSWRLIEKPAQHLRSRWFDKVPQGPARAASMELAENQINSRAKVE